MKMLFIRSIAILNVESIYKRVFIHCMMEYINNHESGRNNVYKSPTYDLIKTSKLFGLDNDVKSMMQGANYLKKKQWKEMVWSRAWAIENRDWAIRTFMFNSTKLLNATMGSVKQIVWWQLGDMCPEIMQECETMAKIVCRASMLKSDRYHFKIDHAIRPYCDLCQEHAIEDAKHIVMHCPF